ncbi:MAG: GntR family transcriptional regulator [Spirochaetia bacterium]|jgi:DNA-binding GntR family transcriptional regulator|nr:GntR family transcriptional regulator [Spirochaetia bacterium]
MEIDPTSATPLYRQVSLYISSKIKSGTYRQGEKIPTENELIETLKISRITVRKAMQELVEDGLLIKKQGKGTFVAEKKSILQANDNIGFTDNCLKNHHNPKTVLLSQEFLHPTQKECDFFAIDSQQQVLKTQRLRYIDNNPLIIEINVYAPSLDFLVNENLNGSLFSILLKHNINIIKSKRLLEIATPTKDQMEILKLGNNEQLLLFTDFQYGTDNIPLFFSRQYYSTKNMLFYL